MRTALLLLVLLAPTAAAAPEQVHLGLPDADAATARSILWLDLDPRAEAATVTVEGPGGPREVAGARIEGPSVGAAFEARLTGLAPDTEYAYRVGEKSFAFRTAPEALSRDRPLRVVALGDMGVSERAAGTVRAVEELAPDLVLHMGDISYAEGRQNEWIDWFRLVEPVAAATPWMTALGNHETYTGASPWALAAPPSPLEIAFYKQRFGLPGNEIWYSFDWAGVHFVALDTFSEDGGIAQAQVAWLEQDLAANAAAPWTIAFLHEPPWSSNDHGSSERVQDAFGALFERHGVDLVLAAHDHGYERTVPMGNVTYVVSGGAGESLYTDWEEPKPSWSAVRGADYHVLLLELRPHRLDGRIVPTQGGDLADSFTLARADEAAIGANEAPGPALALLFAALAVFALARRR